MPEQKQSNLKNWLWISLLVIILDQLTKLLADNMLGYHQPVAVMPMFNLTLMYNTGAAFSFLSDAGGWQRWFFIGLGLIAVVVIVVWLWRLTSRDNWTAAALALVLGGAVGNLVDRIWQGQVTDFLDVYYRDWHWPTFNIADSAISIGVSIA